MSKANKVGNKVLNYIAWMPAVSFLDLCVSVPRDQLLSQYVLAWVPNTCPLDVMLVGLALFKWDKVIRAGGLTLLNGGEFAEPIRMAQEVLIGLAQASVGVDKGPRMGVRSAMRDLCVDLMEWHTTERTWVGSDDARAGSYKQVPYNHKNVKRYAHAAGPFNISQWPVLVSARNAQPTAHHTRGRGSIAFPLPGLAYPRPSSRRAHGGP